MTDEQHPYDDMDIVEVYAASSEVGARRVFLLLEEAGIEAQQRESSVAGFPTEATQRHLVTVIAKDLAAARQAIQTAVDDDVVPGDGILS